MSAATKVSFSRIFDRTASGLRYFGQTTPRGHRASYVALGASQKNRTWLSLPISSNTMSDPRALLSELRALIAPTGFLYVEVPLDKPRLRSWHCSSRIQGVDQSSSRVIACLSSHATSRLGSLNRWAGRYRGLESSSNPSTSTSLRRPRCVRSSNRAASRSLQSVRIRTRGLARSDWGVSAWQHSQQPSSVRSSTSTGRRAVAPAGRNPRLATFLNRI